MDRKRWRQNGTDFSNSIQQSRRIQIKIYNLQRKKQKKDTIKSDRDNSDEHSI